MIFLFCHTPPMFHNVLFFNLFPWFDWQTVCLAHEIQDKTSTNHINKNHYVCAIQRTRTAPIFSTSVCTCDKNESNKLYVGWLFLLFGCDKRDTVEVFIQKATKAHTQFYFILFCRFCCEDLWVIFFLFTQLLCGDDDDDDNGLNVIGKNPQIFLFSSDLSVCITFRGQIITEV